LAFAKKKPPTTKFWDNELAKSQAKRKAARDAQKEKHELEKLEAQMQRRLEQERSALAADQMIMTEMLRKTVVTDQLAALGPLMNKLFCGQQRLPDARCRDTTASAVDTEAMQYLHEELSYLQRQGCRHIAKDAAELTSSTLGLFESVSLALWGTELFAEVLENQTMTEIEQNRKWYCKRADEYDVDEALKVLTNQQFLRTKAFPDAKGLKAMDGGDELAVEMTEPIYKKLGRSFFILRVKVIGAKGLKGKRNYIFLCRFYDLLFCSCK
jgi:hypothetical protein